MENNELNDFTLTYFKNNRKAVVFSYGNIYQFETNYKIAIILKSIDTDIPEYFVTYINLKEIIAFPIGTVIDNQSTTKELAEDELIKLDEKWGKKYPIVLQSWQNKWENLSYYFKYPKEIRKIMYTTNIIESVHRQFRKLTKKKVHFQMKILC